ncbi:MAG: type 4a pilus biogenesis protein PilO [Patescibacteria group bacterium]
MPFDPRTEYHRYRRYFVDIRRLYQKKEIIIYTGLTLSLLTIAFFGIFALKPTVITIASLIKEVQNKREIDRQLQTKINALTSAQTNFALAGNSLTLIDDALPGDPFPSQILYQLEFLAQQEGLTVRSLAVEPVTLLGEAKEKTPGKKIPGPDWVSFSLSLSGNFENLSKFVSSLEKLRRLVTIDSLTFAQSKSEEEKVMSLSISGKTYFLPKKEL